MPHLDAVLALEHLEGVQWVPGDGAPPPSAWPEIYERIFKAGKKTQLWGRWPEVYALLERTGIGPGVHYPSWSSAAEEQETRCWVDRFASARWA